LARYHYSRNEASLAGHTHCIIMQGQTTRSRIHRRS
jgi:hypothetical protein